MKKIGCLLLLYMFFVLKHNSFSVLCKLNMRLLFFTPSQTIAKIWSPSLVKRSIAFHTSMKMLQPFADVAGNCAYTNLMLVNIPLTIKVSIHLATGLGNGCSLLACHSNCDIWLLMSPRSSNPINAPKSLLYSRPSLIYILSLPK